MGRLVKLLIAIALGVIFVFVAFKVSPNFHYFAVPFGDAKDRHYKVIDFDTREAVVISHAEYETPNDVKEGGFSADSTKFAAIYHYEGTSTYTWIGVWSTATGEFLYQVKKPGFTTDLSGVFD